MKCRITGVKRRMTLQVAHVPLSLSSQPTVPPSHTGDEHCGYPFQFQQLWPKSESVPRTKVIIIHMASCSETSRCYS